MNWVSTKTPCGLISFKLNQCLASLGITWYFDEKVAIGVVPIQERCIMGNETKDSVFSWVEMLVPHSRRLDASVNQEKAKDDMRPQGTVHYYLFYAEENYSENYGSADAIEQRLVLEMVRRTEDLEDDVEEEQAIDG
jgi:hypothetical protein